MDTGRSSPRRHSPGCWRCSRPSGARTASGSGQEEIIRSVLAGKDVLTLLPTGAGKSRTYQLPALIRPGLTLVISPLIALIRDQVEKLREIEGMTFVAALVSGMDAGSQEDVLRAAAGGPAAAALRLAGAAARPAVPHLPAPVAPGAARRRRGPLHRHLGPRLPAGLPRHRPAAADRPRRAAAARPRPDGHGHRPGAGGDRHSLGMGQARPRQTFMGDFVRDNLVFRLYHVARREERDALAVGIVSQLVRNTERGGAGIVYVATRKDAVQLARLLRDRNISAQAYHGGMATPERHQVQERFMQGELDVVVATTAFGMGVDKAEIRFVLHYDHPASLEAYVQEAGRAGRDGRGSLRHPALPQADPAHAPLHRQPGRPAGRRDPRLRRGAAVGRRVARRGAAAGRCPCCASPTRLRGWPGTWSRPRPGCCCSPSRRPGWSGAAPTAPSKRPCSSTERPTRSSPR